MSSILKGPFFIGTPFFKIGPIKGFTLKAESSSSTINPKLFKRSIICFCFISSLKLGCVVVGVVVVSPPVVVVVPGGPPPPPPPVLV